MATYNISRETHCKHVVWERGCEACWAIDQQKQLESVLKRVCGCEEEIKACERRLAEATLEGEDRGTWAQKRDNAKVRHAKGKQLAETIRKDLGDRIRRLERLRVTAPDAFAATLDADAKALRHSFFEHSKLEFDTKDNFDCTGFSAEELDGDRKPKSVYFARDTIRATLDYVLDDAAGLDKEKTAEEASEDLPERLQELSVASDGIPPVEAADLAGATNRVQRCGEAHPNVRSEYLRAWRDQTADRKAELIEALRKIDTHAAYQQQIGEGVSIKTFYPNDVPLPQ